MRSDPASRRDREDVPLAEHTASSPLFEKSATELVTRLEHDTSELAQAMAREARSLVQTFRGWQSSKPTPDARIASIQQLFDLHRRAMDYLSKPSTPPPSTPPSSRK
jgi:hypothetical protein